MMKKGPQRRRHPTVAFLFPGTGSQSLGMGRDFDAEIPQVRSYLDLLASELGYDLRETMFNGPLEDLYPPITTRSPSLCTEVISALSLAVSHVFEMNGITPDAWAGRSIGEYTALIAAGSADRRMGFHLVRLIAEQAQKDWSGLPGCVLTAYGLDLKDARLISRAISLEVGACEVICHYRTRRIVVVGGAAGAIAEFERRARSAGATRFSFSSEEGAAHTSLTSGLALRMKRELASTHLRSPTAPLWCNYDARPTRRPDVLRRRLAAQLDHPVLWEEIVAGLAATGIKFFVEIAPGRMLTEFLVPLPAGVEVLPTDTPRRLKAALARLKKEGLATS